VTPRISLQDVPIAWGVRLEILVGLLWILAEVFGELLLEIVLELGLGILKGLFVWQDPHPGLATFGYTLLGAALGGISAWLLPHRILRPFPITGLSLILTPVAAGWGMQAWGNSRRRHGHAVTSLATWFGGGGLAFGIACVRYIAITFW
jgi:hypothetical protein